jgi:hypothetical protein
MQHFPHQHMVITQQLTTTFTAATIPCGHLTAMKKLNLTKPLILHGKKALLLFF